jgi:hypothetical protein
LPSVFVAYPYSISKADYRGAFTEVAQEFDVEFVYADAEITNKHILDKIKAMMDEAEFSLFDITHWNANVSLELGIAIGKGLDYYILFNPTADQAHPPADIGGIDRIQYSDYAELKDGLRRLMRQQFGNPETAEPEVPGGKQAVEGLAALGAAVPDIVRSEPGLQIGGIASSIGVPVEVAQLVVRPLLGKDLVTRGTRRGTRYYLPDDAPPEEETLTEDAVAFEIRVDDNDIGLF